MQTFTLVVSLFAVVSTAAAALLPTPAPQHADAQPWYVKHASNQIVDFCCLGNMFGGGYSIFGNAPMASLSTISFSSLFTQTLNFNTATTLTTTIPGSVVTIFGSPNAPATTSTVSASTVTSVVVPAATTAAVADVRPTERGFAGMIEEVERYAHAVAEAIVAPAEMTALLSSAADDIMKHGFIHATRAEAYITQASSALEALKTDPAYSAQSANLASQPTHINFEKAFEQAKQSHANGLSRFLAEPEARSVGAQFRKLATDFLNTFAH